MSSEPRTISADGSEGAAFELPAADGTPLGATLFEPRGPVRGNVLVLGATAVPQRFYARFARHLAAHGVRVVTFDYRGIGRSRPKRLRRFDASMTDWALLDARGALEWMRERYPAASLAVVGHSFGGQTLGLVDELGDVDAAVLVGAQLGWYGHWPLSERLRLGALWHAVVPSATALLGYLPGSLGLGADLPAGVAREWARWCSHPDYLMGHEPGARDRFARFDRPILFYSFTDDDFAPEASVRAFLAALSSAPAIHRRFAPRELALAAIGHFGFFRSGVEQTLWRETLAFLEDAWSPRRPGLRARVPSSPDGLVIRIEPDEILGDLQAGRA